MIIELGKVTEETLGLPGLTLEASTGDPGRLAGS